MKSESLYLALGWGVARATDLAFKDAEIMLGERTTLSEVVTDKEGDFATFEVLPVQLLRDQFGRCVELRVLAADGEDELVAYIYARDY